MKKLLFSLFFALNGLTMVHTTAQSPDWYWARSATNQADDQTNSVITDKQGNVIFTGFFRGSYLEFENLILSNPSNQSSIFLAKYDKDGIFQWATNSTGTSASANHVCTDSSGNIYITGSIREGTLYLGSIQLNGSSQNQNFFIAKYSPQGDIIWAKSANGEDNSTGEGITVDEQENIWVTGNFFDSVVLDTSILHSAQNPNFFIARYDQTGNLLWCKSDGGDGSVVARSIMTDSNGDIVIGGSYNSESIYLGAITLTNSGLTAYSEIFIAKYNPAGDILWAGSSGGTVDDWLLGLTIDESDDIIITGSYESPNCAFGSLYPAYAGQSDAFVAKYSSVGNPLWVRSVGGPIMEWGNSVTTDKYNNCYITGAFSSPVISSGSLNLTLNGTRDLFVVQYNSNGSGQWIKSVTVPGFRVIGNSICTDFNNNLYLAGDYSGLQVNFGNTTLFNNYGYEDPFLAKLGKNNLSINEFFQRENVVISPNPTTGTVFIEAINSISAIQLYCPDGVLLRTNQYQSGIDKIELNINNLPAGLYILHIIQGNQSEYRKIIKD